MASLENTTVFDVHPLYPPLLVQFSLLLVISVASLPSFAFVLYHLLTTRALYTALNNHVIILLLISNGLQTLTDVPVQLAYFYRGIIWPPSARYCIFYYFIDFDLFTTCFLLITRASFERHILIFHSRWYNTRTQTSSRTLSPSRLLLPLSASLLLRLSRPLPMREHLRRVHR